MISNRREEPSGRYGERVTPTQLRAYLAVVRLGSVKQAAGELSITEAAVSLHIGKLRRELGDQLFHRTASGLAFSPGGLRLASRAAELVGLQNRTILEVSQAGNGRRLLRIAASSLFAEYAAPGLIELFAGRADDLNVELSVHHPGAFGSLLHTRAVDVAIGPQPSTVDDTLRCTRFLQYQLIVVVGPQHPLAAVSSPSAAQLRDEVWLLGPSAAADTGPVPGLLRRLGVAEQRQQIFQSHAAALEEAQRGHGVALAVSYAVGRDVGTGRLVRLNGPSLRGDGVWTALTLADDGPATPAAELVRFVTTPRATQAMLKGSGVHVGRFRPSIHVTLWS
ncbi:DNA-binding transcriptional regulator, LysR family [Jiangella alkaliphila]|uniref:DNA-binding transcriptional regulator, LysR family n=1 Tax=Jiangella alkaliphila TaxID=419479 RepID=A0A1H2KU86_9ACTN|nr:LysR family transcriptional regulator [Jiangella alkaliphila]SDU72213.1 DNA-binding transcriptional regulator, LysR family [Jiangella alkaliphila]